MEILLPQSLLLTDAQLKAAHEEWIAAHPDPVSDPAPEPEPDIDGGPLFTAPPGFENGTTGNYWNVELIGDITIRMQALLDADKPIFLSRSPDTSSPCTCRPLVARKSYQIRGAGISRSVIRVIGGTFLSNPATTEVAGCYAGDFKIFGAAGVPIFDHYGFSNGATHERVNYRGGSLAFRLRPSPADGSAAFKGTINSPFAFNQTLGFLSVEGGNGTVRPLCHLTIINPDIGRCGGAVLQFKSLRAEQSAILIWHGLFDLAQGTMNAPNAVKFIDCQDVAFEWHTGKVTGGKGKTIILADTDINPVLTVVQMRDDPRPAYENFPAFALKTPSIQILGDQNRGVISYIAA